MARATDETSGENELKVSWTSKPGKGDHEMLAPVVERLNQQQGKVRMLTATHICHSRAASAL